MRPVEIRVVRLRHGADLPLPSYQSAHAAGIDIEAAVAANAPVILLPGERAVISTGLAIALPDGFEAQLRPRSGLAARHGVTVLNAPGTIDADYRGEIKVIMVNLGAAPFTVARGTRIAQLVVAAVERARLVEVAESTRPPAAPAASARPMRNRIGDRPEARAASRRQTPHAVRAVTATTPRPPRRPPAAPARALGPGPRPVASAASSPSGS